MHRLIVNDDYVLIRLDFCIGIIQYTSESGHYHSDIFELEEIHKLGESIVSFTIWELLDVELRMNIAKIQLNLDILDKFMSIIYILDKGCLYVDKKHKRSKNIKKVGNFLFYWN